MRDPKAITPYASKGRYWLSYDDMNSIEIKTRYAIDMGIAGVGLTSVDQDDFEGLCHQNIKFPLLKTINRVFNQLNQ